LFLELVDLFVIGDGMRSKVVFALEQAFDGAIKRPLGQACHHQHIVAQRGERFIECSKNMFLHIHRD
jgi:hypothetical protein